MALQVILGGIWERYFQFLLPEKFFGLRFATLDVQSLHRCPDSSTHLSCTKIPRRDLLGAQLLLLRSQNHLHHSYHVIHHE